MWLRDVGRLQGNRIGPGLRTVRCGQNQPQGAGHGWFDGDYDGGEKRAFRRCQNGGYATAGAAEVNGADGRAFQPEEGLFLLQARDLGTCRCVKVTLFERIDNGGVF